MSMASRAAIFRQDVTKALFSGVRIEIICYIPCEQFFLPACWVHIQREAEMGRVLMRLRSETGPPCQRLRAGSNPVKDHVRGSVRNTGPGFGYVLHLFLSILHLCLGPITPNRRMSDAAATSEGFCNTRSPAPEDVAEPSGRSGLAPLAPPRPGSVSARESTATANGGTPVSRSPRNARPRSPPLGCGSHGASHPTLTLTLAGHRRVPHAIWERPLCQTS